MGGAMQDINQLGDHLGWLNSNAYAMGVLVLLRIDVRKGDSKNNDKFSHVSIFGLSTGICKSRPIVHTVSSQALGLKC